MSGTMAVHVRVILGAFLCRPLRNRKVRWPDSALSEQREPRRLFLWVSVSDLSLCPGFSFVVVLTVMGKVSDLRVSSPSWLLKLPNGEFTKPRRRRRGQRPLKK